VVILPRRYAAVAFLLALAPSLHAASRLEVGARRVRAGDSIEITVTLEGDAARTDTIDLPLRNLTLESGPSISSQFSWVNGVTRRQKIFRYSAQAMEPGPAAVGPARAGGTLLPEVLVQVLPPIGDDVSTPDEMMRALEISGRGATFLLAEIERDRVFVGEPLIITWSLFTEELVSDLEVASVPSLPDFWSEELPLADEPTRDVLVNGRRLRKIPVRRAALFPLRAGKLTIGPLVTRAAVMRPFGERGGRFSALNQEIVRFTLRAPARSFDVRPLPDRPIEGVGELTLLCEPPEVVPGGPVAIGIALSGPGNLRAAGRPRFARPPDARVEFVEGEVRVDRRTNGISMSRTWRVLLFPSASGVLDVPEMTFRSFVPARQEVVTLRCAAASVPVTAVAAPEVTSSPAVAGGKAPGSWAPYAAGGVLAAGALLIGFALRRRRRPDDQVERLLELFEQPRAMRTALYELVAGRGLSAEALLREQSQRGDSFRAVQSLIDIAEKETLTGSVSRDELRRRLEVFLRDLR
jgi:hypothetical protein